MQAVEMGTEVANATAESLLAVESTNWVVSPVNKIVYTDEQQANSIAQVTQGLGQISSVVQTSSATAEESAAASKELSGRLNFLNIKQQRESVIAANIHDKCPCQIPMDAGVQQGHIQYADDGVNLFGDDAPLF